MEPKNKKPQAKGSQKRGTVKEQQNSLKGNNAKKVEQQKPVKEKESGAADKRKEKITNRDERITNKSEAVTNDEEEAKKRIHEKSTSIFEPGKLPSKERKEIRKKIHRSQPNDM